VSVPAFSRQLLDIDRAATAAQIQLWMRREVVRLRRRGVVVALSGGIDSSVVGALAARALGAEHVLGLLLPEADSSPESLRLGRALATGGELAARGAVEGGLYAAANSVTASKPPVD